MKLNDAFDTETLLVGTGVVGRAIAQAHLNAARSIAIADTDPAALRSCLDRLALSDSASIGEPTAIEDIPLTLMRIEESGGKPSDRPRRWPTETRLVIESIPEKLDAKQKCLADLQGVLDRSVILTSNTSTLRIEAIAAALPRPEQFAGLHFFMPVVDRDAVEVVRGGRTSVATIEHCARHVRRLAKEPLVVKDSPGFIVNRLLAPYLNEAIRLLCGGVHADRIEAAARRYGMPMSPLELIDWIGMRTIFDSGRVYWQAYPNRIEPAAMLGRMIRRGRLGRAAGKGFYDYQTIDSTDVRSPELSAQTRAIADEFSTPSAPLGEPDVELRLAIPMWIEAALAMNEGVVDDPADFDLAMRGGLAYAPEHSWRAYFDELGAGVIITAIEEGSTASAAMRSPGWLTDRLAAGDTSVDGSASTG